MNIFLQENQLYVIYTKKLLYRFIFCFLTSLILSSCVYNSVPPKKVKYRKEFLSQEIIDLSPPRFVITNPKQISAKGEDAYFAEGTNSIEGIVIDKSSILSFDVNGQKFELSDDNTFAYPIDNSVNLATYALTAIDASGNVGRKTITISNPESTGNSESKKKKKYFTRIMGFGDWCKSLCQFKFKSRIC
jgi:hypothetical protein